MNPVNELIREKPYRMIYDNLPAVYKKFYKKEYYDILDESNLIIYIEGEVVDRVE